MIPRTLAWLVAIAAVLGSGLLHGQKTGRWKVAHEVQATVARLGRVPATVGRWQGREKTLDAEVIKQAGIAGYISRDYIRPDDGSLVSVLVVCGRPASITVHTPDICYVGAGFQAEGKPALRRVSLEATGQAAEFWTTIFGKTEAAMHARLQVLWAWSTGGAWDAPENPRLRFAGEQALYKLYVTCPLGSSGPPPGGHPIDQFIQEFLPQLTQAISPSEAPRAE